MNERARVRGGEKGKREGERNDEKTNKKGRQEENIKSIEYNYIYMYI